jgi:oxygen-independent coproporphyrinogen-3 oxidase
MSTPPGIYIHVPFCERKCTYCNFNTTDFQAELATAYVSALKREIGYWGTRLARPESEPGLSPRLRVDSVYLGGGTPSIVEADLLAALIDACRAAFDVADGSEITIEINPGTLSRQKMEAWRRAGINRASIGVQSFIDSELVSLSRTHCAADARRTVEALRESGFDNISLDLIAGLPEQTLSGWEFNLEQAIALEPEHLSLYLLEIKDGTQLYSQVKRGLRPRPDDDLAAEMYRMMCDATRAAGFEHYEISNFARILPVPVAIATPLPGATATATVPGAPSVRRAPSVLRAVATGLGGDTVPRAVASGSTNPPPEGGTTNRSVHNMKYWTGASFYGMGCGAHSYDGRSRWVNIKKTESYVESVTSKGHGIAETTALSDADRASEALFMGLRLIEGVDLIQFRSDYGLDIQERYGSELARLADAGLVQTDGSRLTLTDRGLLLSNEVFVSFV